MNEVDTPVELRERMQSAAIDLAARCDHFPTGTVLRCYFRKATSLRLSGTSLEDLLDQTLADAERALRIRGAGTMVQEVVAGSPL